MLYTERLLDRLEVGDGSLFLNNERVILISMDAFGMLRHDLIQNIGFERMKGFLIRYGRELGVNDAKKILSEHMSSLTDMIKAGPALHMMKGHADVKTTYLEIDTEELGPVTSVCMEGIWRNSYEAIGYMNCFKKAAEPVCHTLVGYVSGYLSTICNQQVIAKEVACIGKGDPECRWIAKSNDLWGKEIEHELIYYKQTPIVKELEITYEKLLEERNNLQLAATIHKRLTQELVNGKDLDSLAQIIFQLMKLPIIFEDTQFRQLASAGVQEKHLKDIQEDVQQHFQHKQFVNKRMKHDHSFRDAAIIKLASHERIMVPIFLQEHIYGYCSFLYLNKEASRTPIEQMILERISYVASSYFLYAKTSFETAERMKGHFLEEMLNGRYATKKEILQRGQLIHFDLDEPYYMIVLKYELHSDNMKEELTFHQQLIEAITTYSQSENLNILVGQQQGNIVMLVQAKQLDEQQIEKTCWEAHSYLSQQFSTAAFYFGISLRATNILKVGEHYDEAVRAVRMSTATSQVITFQSLGVVGVLINEKNVSAIKRMAAMYLGPLYKCGDAKQQELLRTLYFFLFYGGNLEQTASSLAISISGLRYRVQKIEELLGHNMRNPTENYQLFLSLQALILIGELEM
ncbi:XylR N-terminal domain-containing protein [Bacillus aquiflavi]|uniref:PucR family transcriptional regulator n=1 Tax=Bacillus aquiflavi TaxID=2672567 RepID=A0A6B3W476_9BACI|nr:XylR N-terminal domain-containing protein [Bacillus aquiflavi]MBA4538018.1 XylR N-terminal domain-containing protein [Bacillus aquiflavi]NEY82274.1 PucR family transcriptional regulator [Bacillus aquiflavi]UAC48814.1 XylR N-terminal domain-containing protein [Bacillus aquiflavi]